MAAAGLVAIAVLEAAPAARRSEDLAAPEEMAAVVATAGPWRSTGRPEALAALPVIPERAALVAALLTDLAALAVAAVTAATLMAVERGVAMGGGGAAPAAGRAAEWAEPEERAAAV